MLNQVVSKSLTRPGPPDAFTHATAKLNRGGIDEFCRGGRPRIVGEGVAAPDQLLSNPKNWRTHPDNQQNALASVLDDVGWVQRVIVNRRTGHVVDGYLHVDQRIAPFTRRVGLHGRTAGRTAHRGHAVSRMVVDRRLWRWGDWRAAMGVMLALVHRGHLAAHGSVSTVPQVGHRQQRPGINARHGRTQPVAHGQRAPGIAGAV